MMPETKGVPLEELSKKLIKKIKIMKNIIFNIVGHNMYLLVVKTPTKMPKKIHQSIDKIYSEEELVST